MARFGEFEADFARGELRRAGRRVRLQEHPWRILEALLREPGAEVGRDTLREALWPGRPFVDAEAGINTAVRKLRRALGDHAERPRFVETHPRHGYRFIAAVDWSDANGAGPDVDPEAHAPERARRTLRPTPFALGLILFLGIVLAWAILGRGRRGDGAKSTEWTTLEAPAGLRLTGSFALSPAGDRMAFTADGTDSEPRLFVVPIDAMGAPREIVGGAGASLPFWSPDGRSLGFFAEGELRVVELDGAAAPRRLAAAPRGRGASWSSRGTILFAPDIGSGLLALDLTDGTTRPATDLGSAASHRFPVFVPDGERFLYLDLREDRTKSVVRWGRLGQREGGVVAAADSSALFVAPSTVLLARGRALLSQAVDPGTLRPRGRAQVVLDEIGVFSEEGPTGLLTASVDHRGRLAAMTLESTPRELRWVDRSGRALGALGPPGLYLTVDLDTERGRAAVVRIDDRRRTSDVALLDLATQAFVELTNDPWPDSEARLDPRGDRVAYLSLRPEGWNLFVRRFDEIQDVVRVSTRTWEHLDGWTPDGRALIAEARGADGDLDLWRVAVDGEPREEILVSGPGDQVAADVAADGERLAYVAREGAEPVLRVASLSAADAPAIEVARGDLDAPRWRADGRELYYVRGGRLMARTADGPAGGFGEETFLFLLPRRQSPRLWEFGRLFAVSLDGERFLIDVEATPPPPQRIRVAQRSF